MSSVIRFLETLGQNPSVSAADYASAVDSLHVDPEQQRALLNRDARSLSAMLQGRAAMRCAIFTPPEE
jgi:hypothetical protein